MRAAPPRPTTRFWFSCRNRLGSCTRNNQSINQPTDDIKDSSGTAATTGWAPIQGIINPSINQPTHDNKDFSGSAAAKGITILPDLDLNLKKLIRLHSYNEFLKIIYFDKNSYLGGQQCYEEKSVKCINFCLPSFWLISLFLQQVRYGSIPDPPRKDPPRLPTNRYDLVW